MSTIIQCAAGAKLEPLTYSFADADGNPVALVGYAARVTWHRYSTGDTGDFAATSVVGSTVTLTIPEALTATADTIDLQVWAGDGTTRLDGRRWRVVVQAAAGTAPAI